MEPDYMQQMIVDLIYVCPELTPAEIRKVVQAIESAEGVSDVSEVQVITHTDLNRFWGEAGLINYQYKAHWMDHADWEKWNGVWLVGNGSFGVRFADLYEGENGEMVRKLSEDISPIFTVGLCQIILLTKDKSYHGGYKTKVELHILPGVKGAF